VHISCQLSDPSPRDGRPEHSGAAIFGSSSNAAARCHLGQGCRSGQSSRVWVTLLLLCHRPGGSRSLRSCTRTNKSPGSGTSTK